MALVISNLANQYAHLKEYQKALAAYKEALAIVHERKYRRAESVILNDYAASCQKVGDSKEVLAALTQALELARTVKDRQQEGIILGSLGESSFDQGDLKQARAQFDDALRVLNEASDPREEAFVLLHYAWLERKEAKYNAARHKIEAAISLLETVRTRVGLNYRTSFFAMVQGFYEFYVNLLLEMHRLDPTAGHDAAALFVSERSRARSLLELLAESQADFREGVDAGLLQQEQTLRTRLIGRMDGLSKLLNQKHTAGQETEAKAEIDALTNELNQIQARIREVSPRYAALTQPRPLNLKEIQSHVLDADSVLLEYALGETQSVVWVVTSTSLKTILLPNRDTIEAAARRVYLAVTTGAKNPADFALAAAELSHLILEPVAAELGDRRLLIVADGILQYVPFGALPKPRVQGSASGQAPDPQGRPHRPQSAVRRPLIAAHEIITLPSATTVAVLRAEAANRKPARNLLALVADPVFEAADPRVKKGAPAPDHEMVGQVEPASLTRILEPVVELDSTHPTSAAVGKLRVPPFNLPGRKPTASPPWPIRNPVS